MEEESQKREHFRIEYPSEDCPIVSVKSESFKVLDLSEKGIRFEIGSKGIPLTETFSAKLVLNESTIINISGHLTIFANYKVRFIFVWDKPCAVDMDEADMPKVIIHGETYHVTNLNSSHLHFHDLDNKIIKDLPPVEAFVCFHDGVKFECSGNVLRMQDDESIFLLTTTLPYKRIIKEQRYLSSTYAKFGSI